MKKIIVGIIAVILIVIGVSYFGKNSNQSAVKEPIKIGFIGPLSGDAAIYGETEKNTIQLALDEINDNGGINGRSISIVYEDGKCSGKDAISAAQKLIDIDKVKVILGGTCSAETLAIAPITEKNKILLFSSFSSNPEITNSGDYVFRNSPSDIDVAKLDAETISKLFKKVAIISENADYSQGVRTVMKSIFEKEKIAIVADEIYSGSISDFRTILTKIKIINPDVLYVNPGSSAKAGGIVVKQARELGFTKPIHGNFYLGSLDSLNTGGKFMDAVVISDATNLSDKGYIVLNKYKNKFGKEPAHELLMAANYDRVYLIKEAISKNGYDADKIKDYLYGLEMYSGLLVDYRFDKNGDVVGVLEAIGFSNYIIKDGKKLPYNPK